MATLIQILQHALESTDPLLAIETKRIALKQVLQAYVLDFLYNHSSYRRLCFYGGTCLHIVYGLNRLSEDLDLDNSVGVDLSLLGEDLEAFFGKSLGYREAKVKTQQGGNRILRLTLRLPLLNALGLSSYPNEALHIKLEISHHAQIAERRTTPVFYLGRSFVPLHFSLETMMAAKILACLERSFQQGKGGAIIKGRDYYDLLWLMQKGVQPLKEKLAKEGKKPYTVQSAMQELQERVQKMSVADLATDLLPLFESRTFIESWLESFKPVFERFAQPYLEG